MVARHLEGNFGARVARAGEEDPARLQLPRIAILARVHLQDVCAQILRERGHAWNLITRHRHDDVVGLKPVCARFNEIPAAGTRETIDPRAVSNRQREPARVLFEVVRHLIFRWKRKRRRGEWHADEAVELGRCKQTERVPPVAPGIAHTFRSVEEDERTALPGQVVPDRESRLTTADDDRVKFLARVLLRHLLTSLRDRNEAVPTCLSSRPWS